MVQSMSDVHPTRHNDELIRSRIALDASFVISGICIVGSLIAAVWANGQHVNYERPRRSAVITSGTSRVPARQGYGYYPIYPCV